MKISVGVLMAVSLCSTVEAQFDARWRSVPNTFHNPKPGAAAVFDEATGSIFMVGGNLPFQSGEAPLSIYFSNEIMIFSGSTLSVFEPLGGPIRPRAFMHGVYDSGDDRIVMGGGSAGLHYNDIYEIRGSQINTLTDNSAASPSKTMGIFFNDLTDTPNMIDATGQIWSLASNDWSLLSTSSPAWSGERGGFAYSYAPSRNRLVVFGGESDLGENRNETFIWDASLDEWTQSNSPTSPTARIFGAMVYEPLLGLHVLTGGDNASAGVGPFDDV